MFLDSIALIKTLPCLAEPGKIIVIARPSRSLEQVIPYLATLPGILAYNPATCSLTFRRQPGLMTLGLDHIYLTQVKNVEEGLELLAALVEAINTTWEHRAELAAPVRPLRAPRPLDIWTLLPQTNCKRCGESTCIAFAVGLLQGTRELAECPVIRTDVAFADRKATLAGIL